MGSIKIGILEKITEGDQISREGREAGDKIVGDCTVMDGVLASLDYDVDEADVEQTDLATGEIKEEASREFAEQAETKAEQMEALEEENLAETTDVKERTEGNLAKVEGISGISDIGRGTVDSLAKNLGDSVNEYEDDIDSTMELVNETSAAMEAMRAQLDSLLN